MNHHRLAVTIVKTTMGRRTRIRQQQQHSFYSTLRHCWGADDPEESTQRPTRQHPSCCSQRRWMGGRHDRHTVKPRATTKKQRKTYHRKQQRLQQARDKHNPPGSKAGPKRQALEERKQELLHLAKYGRHEMIEDEYGMEDALMEDLLGNTAHLTSQATPKPIYLGDQYERLHDDLTTRMQLYRDAASQEKEENESSSEQQLPSEWLLPTDHDIATFLRAYRDKHGTRQSPIGIAQALETVLSLTPISAWGEETFTTLVTCSRTPKEARRMMKLMTDHRHAISSYSWSILVDVHAKQGDYEGCAKVLQEMASHHIPPTLAAYTSLLAACYKVCNNGRLPHTIRANAGNVGWRHWQEMRIVGLAADAMAYGAMIRLCAARGQAERAMGLLEEMPRFEVKPTTLCFASALKAVARSHEISLRFEAGWSPKQLKRESLAAHHGNMARQIVIMAEDAHVEQDDAFVSALLLCAGAAGDSATAKAIFLAAEVRRMTHLNTIGSVPTMIGENNDAASLLSLPSHANNGDHPPQSLVETTASSSLERVLDGDADNDAAVLHQDGIEGGGDDSLIALNSTAATPTTPTNRIPPSFEEREYGKDSRSISALLYACAQAVDSNGVGTVWAGRQNDGYLCDNSLRLITTRWKPSYTSSVPPGVDTTKVGVAALRRFDQEEREERKPHGPRKKFRGLYIEEEDLEEAFAEARRARSTDWNDSEEEEEAFDDDADADRLDSNNMQQLGSNDLERIEDIGDGTDAGDDTMFVEFYKELKEYAQEYGDMGDAELSENEARELFLAAKDDFLTDSEEGSADDDFDEQLAREMPDELHDSTPIDGVTSEEEVSSSLLPSAQSKNSLVQGSPDENSLELVDDSFLLDGIDEEKQWKIEEIREALPGLPLNRVVKVVNAFEDSLVSPSMLSLVPILREKMPDDLDMAWLKRYNFETATFVMNKAAEMKTVDVNTMNSMLQVQTRGGLFDEALLFHEQEFKRNRMKPNAYSDRLVLQMLVSRNKLAPALAFKQKVEEQKRILDLSSYGSLIGSYSRRGQLGSAMLMLQECVLRHGSPPREKDIKELRILARQQQTEGSTTDLQLDHLIGQDPTAWLRHGERFLKRERSKRGNRDLNIARNRLL